MTEQKATERALAAARRVWGADWTPSLISRAPGRLELLGNHVDYNGGPVLAAAIDRDAVCALRHAAGSGIAVITADFSPDERRFESNKLVDWRNEASAITPADYVRGVIATAEAHGAAVRNGVQVAIAGDIPIGYGLSSSAALCVALTQALHLPPPEGRELVLRAQEAEHRAGTPCGTMDQSASVGGNVILYDGSRISWEVISPELGDVVFAVADSGVARSLGASSYPRRVEESKMALGIANSVLRTEYAALANLSESDLEKLELRVDVVPGQLMKRIRHVVTETARVRDGVEAMRAADWVRFGELMTASGRSSALDYEISHPRVEQIVEIAHRVPEVLGARMMGGGEGGAALILVKQSAVPSLVQTLGNSYYREYSVGDPDPVKVFRFSSGSSTSATDADSAQTLSEAQ